VQLVIFGAAYGAIPTVAMSCDRTIERNRPLNSDYFVRATGLTALGREFPGCYVTRSARQPQRSSGAFFHEAVADVDVSFLGGLAFSLSAAKPSVRMRTIHSSASWMHTRACFNPF